MKQIKKVAIASVVCAGALATALPASAAVRNLYIAATDGFHHVPNHIGGPPDVTGDGSTPGVPAFIDPASYRKVYMRGFCDDTPAQTATPGCANMPAPIIDVNLGDDVFITLRNIDNADDVSPKDPHTIHLHGQQVTTQNDGFNETSFEVPETPGANQAVYYWYADKPGTFMWHCHVEASEHISMGMYGALIVRPKKAGTVYGGAYNDAYDREYVWMLSDVDSVSRDAIQSDFNPAALAGTPADPATTGENPADIINYNFADYQADYWLINGRAFPDTILGTYDPAACNSDPARTVDMGIDFDGCNPPASGPPSGFLTGANNLASYAPLIAGNQDDRVLVRMINMGYQDQSFHFHGWHFNVVGKDANPVPRTSQAEQYTLQIGSGEAHDVIINMVETANHQNGGSGPNGAGNSLITGQGGGLNEFACIWGVYADASGACNSPLGSGDNNVAVQWYPAHSHYDYQVTNNGGYPGGMAGLMLMAPVVAAAP
jgi:manganese oxidase